MSLLKQAKDAFKTQSLKSPEVNIELEKALEDVKDAKELNTALQLQLDNINTSHQLLKTSYEDLLASNKNLERRIVDLDIAISKHKSELVNVQHQRDKLRENEVSLNKQLEIERLQVKSLKLQTEKDARCILDLNRQIKEMERIMARKHPDSVSALIMAAKTNVGETNTTARQFLEDRIKSLEQEVRRRDAHSSEVFFDVQEKFNVMKTKYESHIEDLELHVNDLKEQLKRKADTFDVYTQTLHEILEAPPGRDVTSVSVQTDGVPSKHLFQKTTAAKKLEKAAETRGESHMLATIRGLQTDLANKEKVLVKFHKEMDELKKTNRRLQKEREGSCLRNVSERREFRSYPDKLSQQLRLDADDKGLEEELRAVKSERDKMKTQLCRIEEDFQNLKTKRIQDVSVLIFPRFLFNSIKPHSFSYPFRPSTRTLLVSCSLRLCS